MGKIILPELIAEILVLIFMTQAIFQLGIWTGIFYLVAIAGAVYDGSLFTKPLMGRAIVIGTIFTWTASEVFFTGMASGDLLSKGIILIFAISIWSKGYLLKKGIIPKEWMK